MTLNDLTNLFELRRLTRQSWDDILEAYQAFQGNFMLTLHCLLKGAA